VKSNTQHHARHAAATGNTILLCSRVRGRIYLRILLLLLVLLFVCFRIIHTHNFFIRRALISAVVCTRPAVSSSDSSFYLIKYIYNIRRGPGILYRYHSYMYVLSHCIYQISLYQIHLNTHCRREPGNPLSYDM